MNKKAQEMKNKVQEVDGFLFKNMALGFTPSGLITTIEEAIRRVHEYGDLTQLAIFMEKAPEDVFGNKEACTLIATALRGELPDRRGKPDVGQMEKDIRNYHVLQFLYFCKGFGHTIRYIDNKKVGFEDACDIASRYVNRCGFAAISADSIYKHIWLKHKNSGYMEDKRISFENSFFKGQIEKKKDEKKTG